MQEGAAMRRADGPGPVGPGPAGDATIRSGGGSQKCPAAGADGTTTGKVTCRRETETVVVVELL